MASRIEVTKDKIRSEVWGEDSVLDTLQHELLELKDKIENARTREDYGTYKNLILAFKEVVHLVHEEEDRNKSKKITTTNLFIENGSFQISEEAVKKAMNEVIERYENYR